MEQDIAEIKGAILKLVDVASRTREDLAEVKGQFKFMATIGDIAEVKGQLKSVPSLWQLVTAVLAINSGIVGVAALAVTLFRRCSRPGRRPRFHWPGAIQGPEFGPSRIGFFESRAWPVLVSSAGRRTEASDMTDNRSIGEILASTWAILWSKRGWVLLGIGIGITSALHVIIEKSFRLL